jgi:subfamily B ATP-binding cassette protein MsbA
VPFLQRRITNLLSDQTPVPGLALHPHPHPHPHPPLTYHDEDHKVLDDVSFRLEKGKKLALVGLSGSGKSTIMSLLLGLYDSHQGDILIDGVSIKDYSLHDIRSLFGLVSQDIFLFHDTIRENLTMGQKFTDAELNRALEISYAREFVDKLPQKLETVIGDRGMRLSGGQQQRLTIARAFLHNSEILLFDEATSALDNESEKIVQKALERIAGNKTVIAVAHRLSTIQNFDYIYVMKEGKIVEAGEHQALITKKGEYAKLYELSL